jgi:PIN domain nuclease of toxin-antitoxin system
MRFLLDTNILLAYLEGGIESFGVGTRRLLEDPAGEFLVSVASLWEIAIKHRIGKLQLSPSLQMLPDLIDAMNIELLPISARHVLVAVEPEPLTRDPFDRLLLAQCQIEDLRLITLDRAIVSHRLAAK